MGNVASRIYKPSDFSAGQMHEMLVTLGKRGFSPEMATEVANGQSGKAEKIVSLFPPTLVPADYWKKFYQDFCGMEVDFSNAMVPDVQGDFVRILGIPQGLNLNGMYRACKEHFPCWTYTDDLDKVTAGLNEREPTKSYFIRVRDRVEADEEFQNTSANAIKGNGIKTETLLARMVHEAIFFHETGNHLDMRKITLCSGSRGSGGSVPGVGWFDDEMRVVWYDPQDADGPLRARAVVS